MIEKNNLIIAIENLNHSVDSLSSMLTDSTHIDEELKTEILYVIGSMKNLTNDLKEVGNTDRTGI